MDEKNYNPERDIPDLSGKVIIVTGGNAGLGRESILALAKHDPSRIYLAARNIAKGIRVVGLVKEHLPNASLTVLECDLSSLESVQQAAKQVASETQRLDILMCNAGVVACAKGQSKDGYEIQFATNHLGHALLIKLLLPMLRTTAELYGDAKIISVTSSGYVYAPRGGINFNTLRSTQDLGWGGPSKRYSQSKLANILYADELARRNPQVTCVSIDPGMAKTELFNSQGWIVRKFILALIWLQGKRILSAEHGAYNQLWAATVLKDRIPVNGGLYRPVGEYFVPEGYLKDPALRKLLWDWTERELEKYTL
ncbi:hypothetical protein GQ44DRAFT_740618 [Phaeosphaeriaceae sp. PMI808]|nr:hypothetical protein GQ44DRAFT_740618 [Phaeosphaeriaceae sp. PMI808]